MEDLIKGVPFKGSEHGFTGHSATSDAPISTIAMAMLFGTITFATATLATRTWLTGDSRAIIAAMDTRAKPLDMSSYSSIYTLLHHSTAFGAILFFAYISEHHPPFPHSEKSYDRDQFFFVVAIVIFASFYTIFRNDSTSHSTNHTSSSTRNTNPTTSTKSSSNDSASTHSRKVRGGTLTAKSELASITEGVSTADDSTHTTFTTATTAYTYIHAADTKPDNDVLNRSQSEEWKGWMQLIFLIYHYYHADEVYNSVRVMITCYVWMTGFGNFSFFYLKRDYSYVRVVQMLWRLNFLVFFLSLSQGTTYILYYICPLHTFFFLMVYFTMRIASHLNYTKYGLRFKLAILALGIYFLWDLDSGIFHLIHGPFLTTEPTLGATNGTLWEWYFRTTLDHWSTFLGMIFAANFPITSLFYRKLEALPAYKCWLAKGSIAIGLIVAFIAWVKGPFHLEKFPYNRSHSYFGFIPLLTYIYLRNLTPTLRSYSLRLLHEIGKTTLETYLMQHHIWLTSNAKTLLTIIPGWPKVNMFFVTFVYFYTSRRLYRLTLFLRSMLLPDDRAKCNRSLLSMISVIAIFYVLAHFLDSIGYSNLLAIGMVSVVCGLLLYQTVIDSTWIAYRESAISGSHKKEITENSTILDSVMSGAQFIDSDSFLSRLFPQIVGSMVLLIFGIAWHGMAVAGAGKIVPLHAGCDAFANSGQWILIDGCNEVTRGAAYRNFGISSLGTCNPTGGGYVWGWDKTPSSMHCRFAKREAKALKKSLRNRRLVFVGDSMIRHLYHALNRQLGIDGAGGYDATLAKHSDIHNTIDKTGTDFKWAPLARDQLATLKDINELAAQQALSKADLIVMGGGVWDQLHVFATDEDQESHRLTLNELAKEMIQSRKLGTPVVWTIPTIINTPALNTEEKRDHMTEEDMVNLRSVYVDAGILASSSFILDGPNYTRQRVKESYDGVHYPLDVYDAGAQILANSFDWLLPENLLPEPFEEPKLGTLSNPFLGLMMLCFCFIGLMFFDGFMGFSYIACIFVKGILPSDLYEEAFTILHKQMNLPKVIPSSSESVMSLVTNMTSANTSLSAKQDSGKVLNEYSSKEKRLSSVDEEIAALLGPGTETEMRAI